MRRFGLVSWLWNIVLTAFVAVFILSSSPSFAQQQQQAQQQQPPMKSAEELQALLAPIALYPDELLANVLMASTYPLEVVSAARWQTQNASLKGSALESALAKQTWDDSVKALVHVPTALQMMNERLDWTQKLGDTFLAQQEDVMKSIQTLRGRAQKSGTLKDTPQQKVVVEEKTIVIEPADPEVVYVPYYDTRTVYGTWPPTYPPYYWGAPYGYAYGSGAAAFGFVAGVAVTAAFWNNGCNWGGNNVYVNSNRNVNRNTNVDRGGNRGDRSANRGDRGGDRSANRGDRGGDRGANRGNRGGQSWQHNPSHRGGVNYSNNQLRDKYGKGTRPGAGSRESFRGFEDRRGSGNSAYNIGDRGNTAGNRDRASAGNRQAGNSGNRVADRSSGGGRRDMNNASARGGGFDGVGRGSQTRQYSQRGSSSMASRGGSGSRSMSRGSSGGSRSMSRGGGGGGRGGGGRGGGRR